MLFRQLGIVALFWFALVVGVGPGCGTNQKENLVGVNTAGKIVQLDLGTRTVVIHTVIKERSEDKTFVIDADTKVQGAKGQIQLNDLKIGDNVSILTKDGKVFEVRRLELSFGKKAGKG